MSGSASEFLILESVSLEKAKLSKFSGDVIKIEFYENVEIDIDDIKTIQGPKLQLSEGNPYYFLVVAPQFASVSKEAREYSAGQEVNQGAMAKAIVITNLSMRLIVSFFISVNKPPIPHRIFSTESSALEWFAELKNKALTAGKDDQNR